MASIYERLTSVEVNLNNLNEKVERRFDDFELRLTEKIENIGSCIANVDKKIDARVNSCPVLSAVKENQKKYLKETLAKNKIKKNRIISIIISIILLTTVALLNYLKGN